MSTRANIGIVLADGIILSVYVHNDGYPEYIASVLQTSLKNKLDVIKFISGGDCSAIYNLYDYKTGTTTIDPIYYRDETSRMHIDADMNAYIKHMKDSWYEYSYLFMDGNWMYSSVNISDKDKVSDEDFLHYEELPVPSVSGE